MSETARYRVQYTEMIPGGARYHQDDLVRGTLADVRDYLDARHIWAADPIVIIEHTQSDSPGRIVPASEWDVCE
jgi:hypothetical protein